ncbi:MAG: hypothetical protein AAF217_10750 [Pseudomonadota bacterium]
MRSAQTSIESVEGHSLVLNQKRLADLFIGLAVFSGGFVVFEPAPYELLLAGLLFVSLLFGMRVPTLTLPILIPVTTLTIGGLISSFMIEEYMRGVIYNAVTFFLGLTSAFFAIIIVQEMGRLRLIFRFYVVSAACTSMLGILGYFNLPGFEMFTRYDRAQGAFADPNVFAPYLVPPILYLIYGIMNRSPTLLPLRVAFLLLILLGEFLAFSRAAWGLTVISAGMFYCLLLVNAQSSQILAKYILLGVAGLAALIVALIAALQVDAIWDLFVERAQVVQHYDGARVGRFARHAIGFDLALTKPFGIGNLEFGFLYGEDEHNVYLRALLSYGWLGFLSWIFLVFTPLIIAFRLLFKVRPWQVYLQIAYVVFLGHMMVAWVIDIDHWRHVFLLLGVIWGCVMLEQKYGATANPRAPVRSRIYGGNPQLVPE